MSLSQISTKKKVVTILQEWESITQMNSDEEQVLLMIQKYTQNRPLVIEKEHITLLDTTDSKPSNSTMPKLKIDTSFASPTSNNSSNGAGDIEKITTYITKEQELIDFYLSQLNHQEGMRNDGIHGHIDDQSASHKVCYFDSNDKNNNDGNDDGNGNDGNDGNDDGNDDDGNDGNDDDGNDDDDDDEKFIRNHMKELRSYRKTCGNVIYQVKDTIELGNHLREQYELVLDKTRQLHKDCEKYLKEKEELSKICNDIELKLNYFNEMEQFSQDLNSGVIDLHSPEFSSNLELLEESIQFLFNHLDYKESKSYLMKYKQLMSRSLARVRDFIVDSLRNVHEKIQRNENDVSSDSVDESFERGYLKELSDINVQFRISIESSVKPLIQELERRAYIKEYAVFLMDSFECYFEQRKLLVYPIIENQMQRLIQTGDMNHLLRVGCNFMIQLCSEEEQMFKHFFSHENVTQAYRSLIDYFSGSLYGALRTMVIYQDDLDILCGAVSILQTEILKSKGGSLLGFEQVIHRMIQDVQERLIYKSSVFISENLRYYKLKSEDLDYPSKLILQNKKSINEDVDSQTKGSQFVDYHPLLSITLRLLNKLYHALDTGVFEGLAQEAVSICLNSFIEASKKISEKKTVIDGELFLIKHLLTFREELSDFAVNFQTTQVELDFSHLRDGITRFLTGKTSFKVHSIIFDIMSQSRPRIIHNHVDSKRDIEKQLKTVCESFILNVTRLAFDSIMNLLKKVSALRKTNSLIPSSISADEIIEVYQGGLNCLRNTMNQLKEKLQIYLTNKQTRKDLSKAVKSNVCDIYQEFYSFIGSHTFQSDKEKTKIFDTIFSVSELQATIDKIVSFD